MNIKFNYEEVEQYCNELHSVSIRMQDTLEKVKNEIKKIQSGENWIGPASDKFIAHFNKTSETFSDVYDVLDKIVLYIAQCSSNYENLDNMVINQIRSNISID